MLPINNLAGSISNSNAMASSYLNDYKLYRDVGPLFPPKQPPSSLTAIGTSPNLNSINNASLNNASLNSAGLNNSGLNLVVNNLSSLNSSLGNHNNGLNALPNHNQLNAIGSLPQQSGKQQQQQQLMNNNPEFVRLISNCDRFLRLNMYQPALEEVDNALNLVASSTAAHFRKSQALLGLKRFYECEKELWTCINLEPNMLEYRDELLKVKQMALMSLNLNLDPNTIATFAQKYESIKEAVEALTWSNNPMDYSYSTTGVFHSSIAAGSGASLSEATGLMNGWSLPTVTSQPPTSSRFGSTMAGGQFNQLMNRNSLIFNNINNLSNNLIPSNLLQLNSNLNSGSLINRSNSNGTGSLSSSLSPANSLTNSAGPPGSAGLTGGGLPSAVGLRTAVSTPTSSNPAAANSNLINSSSSNSSSAGQQISNSPLNSNTLTDQPNLLTNGLSNGSRFNFLLRGLDQPPSHLLGGGAAQLTANSSINHSANSNQNLINQQQTPLFNRIMPSYIVDNSSSPAEPPASKPGHVNLTSSAAAAATNQTVLNCSRDLSSKLTLNDNSLLNGNSGLLLMNSNLNSNLSNNLSNNLSSNLSTNLNSNLSNNLSNNLTDSAPSPICAKPGASTNTSTTNGSSSAGLTNSCNYNIFNQMPEMKLIETIVPSLLGTGSPLAAGASASLTTSSNPISELTPTVSPANVPLDAVGEHHKLLASLAEEVNNNHVKDSLVSNLVVDNFTGNVTCGIAQPGKQQEASNFENCASKTIGKLDLLNELTAATDKVVGQLISGKLNGSSIVDSFKSSSINQEDSLISSFNPSTNAHLSTGSLISDHDSLIGSTISSTIGSAIGSTISSTALSAPSASSQLTSYSDIVKRAKKISTTCANGYGSREHSRLESDGGDEAASAKRPTNLWAYNGLRVANVSTSASKSSLMNLFSKFGRVRLLERIVNKTTANNIWVYYDNPVAPVDAVTKLQNVYVEGISVDSDSPLRLFFAPTDDQKDLKFSRPKQPPDNKGNGQLNPNGEREYRRPADERETNPHFFPSTGECYYWRTTNCFSKDQCPLLHLPANKNIDAQIWMRLLKENPEKEPEENETAGTNAEAEVDA